MKCNKCGFEPMSENGIVCPRCGKIFHDKEMDENPEKYWICPVCSVIQHTKCRGNLVGKVGKVETAGTKVIKCDRCGDKGVIEIDKLGSGMSGSFIVRCPECNIAIALAKGKEDL